MTTHDPARRNSVLTTFDSIADRGEAARHELLFGDVARQVIEGMAVRPGQQLLELGCGAGWATKRLGKKAPGAQAVGIDVSARMIAFADSETDWTSRARFECMPMEALDLPDDRFDHVLAIGSLELSDDAALAEIIDNAISETGAESMRDMGKVMGKVKAAAAGRADMSQVSAIIKARLAG